MQRSLSTVSMRYILHSGVHRYKADAKTEITTFLANQSEIKHVLLRTPVSRRSCGLKGGVLPKQKTSRIVQRLGYFSENKTLKTGVYV